MWEKESLVENLHESFKPIVIYPYEDEDSEDEDISEDEFDEE